MKKYRLINLKTKEEHLCDKVTIDGFDYYVSDDAVGYKYGISKLNEIIKIEVGYDATLYNGIFCSTNPNIDIPKVRDEAEYLAQIEYPKDYDVENRESFIDGYNKAKETYQFTNEDMISFHEWYNTSDEVAKFWRKYRVRRDMNGSHNKIIREKRKELFKVWKEQQPTTIYYE